MVEIFRPDNLDEALEVRRERHARPFAGGTDLMVRYRKPAGILPGIGEPVLFLDRCEDLGTIRFVDGGVSIGATATMSQIVEHPDVDSRLKDVLTQIAAPALRNTATVGGNICNASPAADTLPFLYCMDADVVLKNVDGERILPVEQFISGPGAIELRDDEILTSIYIPHWRSAAGVFRKVGTRRANALTKVSFAGYADMKAGRITRIAMAVGAVGPTVSRLRSLEERCADCGIQEILELMEEIPGLCSAEIRPIDDQRSTAQYRGAVAENLIRDFLGTKLVGEPS